MVKIFAKNNESSIIKTMKKIIIAIVVIIVIILVWFYSQSTPPDTNVTPTPITTDTTPVGEGTLTTLPASTTDASPTGPVKEFTVISSNFSFTPNTLEVKQGDIVKITFKNANGFHDFKIDELQVATKQIKSGESETVQFVVNKTGTFEYYCSVGNHRAMGMKGTLTVK